MAQDKKEADETRLLKMLENNPEDWHYTSDLAYGLGHTTGAAGRVLERMAKRGEVKTMRDERHRRLWSLRGELPEVRDEPTTTCLACGWEVPGGYMCQNPVHQEEGLGLCACKRPHCSRRECMEATGNRTPCRCLCHKRVKGQQAAPVQEAGTP